MKRNVGSFDCAARFVLGCLVLMLVDNGLGWWALLGLVPLASAVSGRCLIYGLLHVDTVAWEDRYERRHGR